MRFYVGDRSEGNPRVFIIQREPRPDISEVVEVLADLERLPRWHAELEPDAIDQRAAFKARKDDLVARLKVAENADHPVRLVHRGVHSREGFEWGFSGHGPADLAHSILTNELGEEAPPVVYLRFRDDVVAKLPRQSFELPSSAVMEWVEANRELVDNELFLKIPPPGPEVEDNAPALAVMADPELMSSAGSADTSVTAIAPDTDPKPLEDANDAPGPTASALVRACEEAWADIQAVHPEVPDAVMLLGTGVERGRLVKLGHWWGGRWLADGQVRGEVLLAGEALHLKPAEVFEVLLHEAAHGLNAARGVKDTSRGGRYHNERFRAAAEEVGLEVKALPPYGMAATSLPEAGQERYAGSIKRLEDEMRIARQLERGRTNGDRGQEAEGEGSLGGDGTERSKGSQAAGCGCGRKLRMAPSVLAKGPVVCGLCTTEFSLGRTSARSVEAPAADGRSGIEELLASPANPDPEVLFEWYNRFDTAAEEPMRAASAAEADQLVGSARELLKAERVVSGPELVIGGRGFAKGDRVVVPHGDAETDVPARTLGTVEHVDPELRVMEVDFATAGRYWMGPADAISRALRHDYAEVRPPVASDGNGGGRLSAEVRPDALEVAL